MKKTSNILYWMLLAGMLFYFLYQKGFIFTNFENVTVVEASVLLEDDNVTFLDVRTPKEFKEDGYIESTKLIPLGELSQNLKMLDKSKKVLVYCRTGSRSVTASRMLGKNGFVAINMKGGIVAWKSSGYAVKK